ncbi:MAG: NAD+ synthase [Planctomycetota bacterium]|nr:NAD+ synthase [Planctomycetota bacterium]
MILPPPPGLKLDLAEQVLVAFLREEIERIGLGRAVLGLSGGVDSALVVELAARALGPDRVLAVAMPYRSSASASLELARESAAHAGVQLEEVDVSPAADALFLSAGISADPNDALARLRRGNVLARLRMVALYDRSARDGALVLGTSNKTELLLGYGTQHGDMASALNPIGDLYKGQVYALSERLGVPREILDRPPSADLWEGQTDEQELGASYATLDALLHRMVDRRYSRSRLIELGFEAEFLDAIAERVRRSHFKRRPPLIAKLANRTINLDWRYARDWGT